MSVKLSPAIKHLLTVRNPNAPPAPPIAKLFSVLKSTHSDARQKQAVNGWLTLATCSLLTANMPSSVGHLYQVATRTDPDVASTRLTVSEATNKAALIREAALKSTIFIGVPRVILSLAGLQAFLEDDVKAGLRKESRRIPTRENIDELQARGKALWSSIYKPHAEKLHAKLGAYHPDFIGETSILSSFLRPTLRAFLRYGLGAAKSIKVPWNEMTTLGFAYALYRIYHTSLWIGFGPFARRGN
ncbi:unnamed protein product [Somion occarium]|uniref:Uncharacterized protein n=1 Tax=Somion occarium TaxID=3059160 RepID=A0ABP1D2Z2_9APHY